MRVLVTGGAGFIGSHFVKRLVAGGDEVVVLDKLTYAGNPANLDGTGAELVVGDIADPEAVARAAAGLRRDRQLRRRDPRRPLDPRPAGVRPHRRARDDDAARVGAGARRALRPGVDRRGLRRPRGRRTRASRTTRCGRRARTAPRRPAATCRCSRTCRTYGVDASITRGANTYGPNQYPEKLVPLFVTNALDGEPLPVYGDGKQVREWLHAEDHCAGVELVLREGAPGEIYNVGGEDHENIEVTHRILELTGADPSLDPPRRGPGRARSALRARRREAPVARLVAGALLRRGRASATTVDWYRANRAWWEPIKSGDYRRYYEEQYADAAAVVTVPSRSGQPCAASSPPSPLVLVAAVGRGGSAHGAPKPPQPAFVLAGGGWGHGVGMSQWGAFGQAKAGRDYRTILGHYYRGTEIGSAPAVDRRAGARRSSVIGLAKITLTNALAVFDANGQAVRAAGRAGDASGRSSSSRSARAASSSPSPGRSRSAPTPRSFLTVADKGYRGDLRVAKAGAKLQLVNVVGLEDVPPRRRAGRDAEGLAARGAQGAGGRRARPTPSRTS